MSDIGPTDANLSNLKVELSLWRDVLDETIRQGGSIGYCEQVIGQIVGEIKSIERTKPKDDNPLRLH